MLQSKKIYLSSLKREHYSKNMYILRRCVYKNLFDMILVFIAGIDTAYGYFLDLLNKVLSRCAYSNLLINVFTHLKNDYYII